MTLILDSLKSSPMNYLFLMLLVVACSSPSFKQTDFNKLPGELPVWVYSPYEVCQTNAELCLVGEGKDYESSHRAAEKMLSDILNSKSDQLIHYAGHTLTDEFTKNVYNSVDEVTKSLLSLTYVKNKIHRDGTFYTLLALDRQKASMSLEQAIHTTDAQLLKLWAKKIRTSFYRMHELYHQRTLLNQRLGLLTDKTLLISIDEKDLMDWKMSLQTNERLLLKHATLPDWLLAELKSLFSDSGFRIVNSDANKVVKIDFHAIKEDSATGKYTFSLELNYVKNGQQISELKHAESVTGRSQAEALLKVKPDFLEFFRTQLHELKID